MPDLLQRHTCIHVRDQDEAQRQLSRRPVSNVDGQRAEKPIGRSETSIQHTEGVMNIGMVMNSICTGPAVFNVSADRRNMNRLGFCCNISTEIIDQQQFKSWIFKASAKD